MATPTRELDPGQNGVNSISVGLQQDQQEQVNSGPRKFSRREFLRKAGEAGLATLGAGALATKAGQVIENVFATEVHAAPVEGGADPFAVLPPDVQDLLRTSPAVDVKLIKPYRFWKQPGSSDKSLVIATVDEQDGMVSYAVTPNDWFFGMRVDDQDTEKPPQWGFFTKDHGYVKYDDQIASDMPRLNPDQQKSIISKLFPDIKITNEQPNISTKSRTIEAAVKFARLGAPKYQFIPDFGNLGNHPEIGQAADYFGVDGSVLTDPTGVSSDLVCKGVINCDSPPRGDNTWRGYTNFIFPERISPPFFVREMILIDPVLMADLHKNGNWGSTLTLGRDRNDNFDVSITTLIGGTRGSIYIDSHAPSSMSDEQWKPAPLQGSPPFEPNQWADAGLLVMPDNIAHLFVNGVHSGLVGLFTNYRGQTVDNRLGWIHGGPIYVGTTKGEKYTPGGYALSKGLTVYSW